MTSALTTKEIAAVEGIRHDYSEDLTRPASDYHRQIGRLLAIVDRLGLTVSSVTIDQALTQAFPHFQEGRPITPEAIAAIGKEYLEMVSGWAPVVTELWFQDQDGNTRKLVFEEGELGPGGWSMPEDAGWVVRTAALDPVTIEAAAKVAETERVPCHGHPQIDAPTIDDARTVIAAAIRALGPQTVTAGPVFFHSTPKPDACDHVWDGPEIEIGPGLARTCSKCGMDAMSHSLRTAD